MDLSTEAIKIAQFKADVNKVEVSFACMDAEEMGFPDRHFDFVVGLEALHHVILYPNSVLEIHRVLKPGGKAVFAENWGADNKALQYLRERVTLKPSDSKNRGETILGRGVLDSAITRSKFTVDVFPLSLLGISKRAVRSRGIQRVLARTDKALLRMVPRLGAYCGEAVILLNKP